MRKKSKQYAPYTSKVVFSVLFILFTFLIGPFLQAQTLIAGWDFQTSSNGGTALLPAPNTSNLIHANFGSGSIFLNGSIGSSVWSSSTTGTELNAFNGTTFNAAPGFSTTTSGAASLALVNTTANNKSIVFQIDMSGYVNLVVSYAAQRTSSGFTTQQWDYSTDGTNWVPVQTINSIATSFGVHTLNSISGLNFVSTAYLRLTVSGATTAAGNNRIDNIQLKAQASLAAPVIYPDTIDAVVGQSLSYQIQATASPQSYQVSNLPSGLSIDTLTGIISGVPSAVVSYMPLSVSATNSSGTGSATLTLHIEPGIQTINFNSLPPKTYGDSPFLLNATGGNSGNPVVFSSSDTTIAFINNQFLFIAGAGTCTITATQAGNANYQAASPVQQPFIVNPATQVINFPAFTTKYINDPPFLIQASGGASGNPINYTSSNTSVATVSGNQITISGQGTTTITATQSGNNNYYPAAPVAQTLTVQLLPQVITFNALPPKIASDPPFSLSATGGGSGNPITYSTSNPGVATISGNMITIVGAGICAITASQAGNSLYDSASSVTQTLIVSDSTSYVLYTFGPGASPTALPTSTTPLNILCSQIGQGNNANTSQTSLTMTTTSASSGYSGASGQNNAGITARNRSYQQDSSAYFELSITPSNGYTAVLHGIQFGSRSTSTGPTTLDIRTSLDNYTQSKAMLVANANSAWSMQSASLNGIASNTTMTIRIYGYVTGGSGSISTGLSPNNWRVDDIQLTLSSISSFSCNLSASVSASPIQCHGDSTQLVVSTLNANGQVSYRLNQGPAQTSNVFDVTAGTYTISVSDAYLCESSTVINITEPEAVIASSINVNACEGLPVMLTGYPAGGVFSISNPYTGPSTTFTYIYTDSNGCTGTSSPANVNVTQCASINLTLFLQSYYLGSNTMSPGLFNQGVSLDQTDVDYITVELRDPNSYLTVASELALLKTNGTASVNFPSINGYYFVVIKHRNTLQTWTSIPYAVDSTALNLNFSSDPCISYNCNAILVDSFTYAFVSGELVQDDNIDLLDLPVLEADIENFVFGYTASDLNGDGNTDLLDLPTIEINIANFQYAQHPSYIAFPETMEDGVKSTYAAANINLATGSWNFNDALIGTSTLDRKFGAKSARIQNTGSIGMNFNVFVNSSTVTVWHARYSSESSSTWVIEMSTDNGTVWTQQGGIMTTSSTTLQSTSLVINYVGSVRFRIRKLSGGRLNLDDFTVSATTGGSSGPDNDHIGLGNPSGAVTDLSFPDNYLVIKSQFDLAYNNSKGTADWVAWHLDPSDLGTTPRCDCFATDLQLPSTFYRASSSSYTGTGFDRGHQVPSSHRNNNLTNNAATFLMSNIMPQSPNLNQVTWVALEEYCTDLVQSGYELYTYSGGYGMGGTGLNGGVTNTIAGGNITVPSHYWKIVVALPVGTNDINRISTSTRVIAVSMPNTQTVNAQTWGTYRTSVDAIETATGFDFFSTLSSSLQATLESQVDNGPTN